MADNENGIVYIGTEHIHTHPENPRKDLGDLTELAESMKKNGCLQNLTLVPVEGQPGEYYALIGNRRHGAAKLAGLSELPSRIIEGMSKREQLSTMLEENMQRSDLTVWEQAQGFQLMLDLGETEDSIAEKTGFSKTTIRHRLNIAKLDQKTLREKERENGFQLTLSDLYELEKIKDIKIRDKILKDAENSRDLARRAINAQTEQIRKENLKGYIEVLKKAGVKKATDQVRRDYYNTGKMERLKEYSLDKEPPKSVKFEDNGEQIYYMDCYGRLYVIRKVKKTKKVLTPEEEAKKQKERNKKQIKAILKEATSTRRVFIEGIISGRIEKIKDTKEIEAELFEQMLSWESFVGRNKLKQFFLGCEVYNADKEDIEAAEKKCEGLSLLHKMLCIVSVMVGDVDLVDWNYLYNTTRGEKVKAFYSILKKYGFQFPTDEEEKVIMGTSELYAKKEET